MRFFSFSEKNRIGLRGEPARCELRRTGMQLEVRELLAARDGVITRAQAMDTGLSSAAVGRLVSSGAWRAYAAGVYVATDRAMTPRARLRAASASVGRNAVVAGLASAWWQNAAQHPPRQPLIVRPQGKPSRGSVGAVVVQRALQPVDVVVRDGLRVVGLPFAVLEAAAVEGDVDVLDRALLRRMVTLDQVAAAHARYPGRRGAAAAERLLVAAAGGARSEAERRTHALLRAAGIGGWQANADVAGYVGDLVFADAKVIVEIDGFAFHTDPEAFQRDRERRNALVAAGWTILHFTWRDVTERPAYVIASIHHAI